MTLYVRRISQTWAGKYDMFNFIQDTFNGYSVNSFTNMENLSKYLREYFMSNIREDDDNLVRNDVFSDDTLLCFHIIDTEEKESYMVTVDYKIDVMINKLSK